MRLLVDGNGIQFLMGQVSQAGPCAQKEPTWRGARAPAPVTCRRGMSHADPHTAQAWQASGEPNASALLSEPKSEEWGRMTRSQEANAKVYYQSCLINISVNPRSRALSGMGPRGEAHVGSSRGYDVPALLRHLGSLVSIISETKFADYALEAQQL